jgi:hypothetical protein
MARIIYGSIITDIKGSIGGLTFQKNGSGTIARLKPRKNKTNTQKQRDQQPRLKQVQKEWNELTLVNKILWNDFAAVNNKIGLDGQEKKLTGYQWFLSINENRLLFEDSILLVPPVYEIVNPITGVHYVYDNVDDLKLIVNSGSISGRKLCVYTSFVVNSVSKFDFNKCRNLYCRSNPFSTAIQINTLPSFPAWNVYYNQTFPPNLGNKAFYLLAYIRVIGANSGISSLAYTAIAHFVWDGAKYVIE